MPSNRGNRGSFGRSTASVAKKHAGRTKVAHTPLRLRTLGLDVSDETRRYVRAQMGAKLGKYAERIERLTVRLADVNGPRGGTDKVCRVKVVLSGLDPIVFESRSHDLTEAMNLAATGVQRAVRRVVERGERRLRSPRARTKAIRSLKRGAAGARRGGSAPEASRTSTRALRDKNASHVTPVGRR